MSTGGVSDGEADTASSAGGGAQAEAQRQSDQRSSREGAMAPPGSRDEEGAGGLRPAWWPGKTVPPQGLVPGAGQAARQRGRWVLERAILSSWDGNYSRKTNRQLNCPRREMRSRNTRTGNK